MSRKNTLAVLALAGQMSPESKRTQMSCETKRNTKERESGMEAGLECEDFDDVIFT